MQPLNQDRVEIIARLLTANSVQDISQVASEYAEFLLTDEADGILAVFRHTHMHDRRFQEQVDWIRWVLDEAREKGHDGINRPLSQYFNSNFDPSVTFKVPDPPETPPGDKQEQLLTHIVTALILSQSWRERKRIVSAYQNLLLSREAVELLKLMGEHLEWSYICEQLRVVLATAYAKGIKVAFAPDLPSAFVTIGEGLSKLPMFTLTEQRQLAMAAFIDTPSWDRRKEVLRTNKKLLTSDEADKLIKFMQNRYPKNSNLKNVSKVLKRTRTLGIENAFNETLPPTCVTIEAEEVRKAFATRSQSIESRLDKIAPLRQFVHYLDPLLRPWKWAEVNLLLAGLLKDFPDKDLRPLYIEEAILRCNNALYLYNEVSAPEEWRKTYNLLGSIFLNRTRDDPADNVEFAINCFEKIFSKTINSGLALDSATLATQLSLAYRIRKEGIHVQNLEIAYHYGTEALRVFTKEKTPKHWAWTQITLAQICLEETYPFRPIRRAKNLEEAIDRLKNALPVLTLDKDPDVWFMAHQTLGTAYSQRKCGPPSENLTAAIHYLSECFKVFGNEEKSWHWGAVHHSIGTAYFRQSPDDPEARAKAISHYKESLSIFNPALYPSCRRRTLRELGAVYFREQRWKDTLTHFEEAIKLGDFLENSTHTQASHFAEIGEIPNVYTRMAFCLLKLGKPVKAFLQVDVGKTRFLKQNLIQKTLEDTNTSPHDLKNGLETAQTYVRELENKTNRAKNIETLQESAIDRDLYSARNKLKKARCALEEHFHKTVGKALTTKEFLALIPENGALVNLVITSEGSAAFVIRGNQDKVRNDEVVPFENITDRNLKGLLENTPNRKGYLPAMAHWNKAKTEFTSLLFAKQKGQTVTNDDLERATENYEAAKKDWYDCLDYSCGEVWNIFMGPIHNRLDQLKIAPGAPVVFIHSKWLSLLPLHAAWRNCGTERSYFLDDYSITYTPSAVMLANSQNLLRQRSLNQSSLLCVTNPTGDLENAEIEGEKVSSFFKKSYTKESNNFTVEQVLKDATDRTHIHFACHGSFNWFDIWGSGIDLAGGRLTMRDITSRLNLDQSCLVTLSACESGITESDELPNEFLGLPGAFLYAGAPAVVSTLWAVNDLSTMLLMEHFYQRLLDEKDGLPPAQALRAAQVWLKGASADKLRRCMSAMREKMGPDHSSAAMVSQQFRRFAAMEPEARPFAHPYYWAGFTFSGA